MVQSRRILQAHTTLPQHGGFRVSFLASTRGPNVGRSFVLLLPSHRGPKLEPAGKVLDFEIVGILPLPIIFSKFHRFSTLTIDFFLPVFQKFQSGPTVNGPHYKMRRQLTRSSPFRTYSSSFTPPPCFSVSYQKLIEFRTKYGIMCNIAASICRSGSK
ncbi:hypothetical protein AVEN_25000-1 [Araneus ventricosus]|uniref:Uncharacterized protein n=1 Tax=Araneus ventricosus TaxID=182803 RepID=A0A4Y2FHE2_ARAVE|nr:hypothetical protein AVEN_25000-1 [Araneus ventricosus]